MNKQRAFTLLELLLTLTLLALLLLAAVPAMRPLLLQGRATQGVERLVAAIHYARTEAIQRSQTITLCGSVDHRTCGGQWRDGQIILAADNRVLRVYSALPKGDNLIWRSNLGQNSYLRFAASGFTNGQNGSFYYCPANKNTAYARAIVVEQSGRTRIETAKAQTSCEP